MAAAGEIGRATAMAQTITDPWLRDYLMISGSHLRKDELAAIERRAMATTGARRRPIATNGLAGSKIRAGATISTTNIRTYLNSRAWCVLKDALF